MTPGYTPSMAPAPVYGGYAGPMAAPTNTLAIISLVLSICSFLFCPFLLAIAGVICGHIARGQIRRMGQGGSGIAMAGIIIGYVNIGISVLFIFGFIVIAILSSITSTPTTG